MKDKKIGPFHYEPDTRKFPCQQCQDKELNEKFRAFHKDLVNQIIKFCKDNNIMIDEFHLNADELSPSIECGKWIGFTDSSFTFMKFTDEYKDVLSCKKIPITTDEFDRIKADQEPFMFSM